MKRAHSRERFNVRWACWRLRRREPYFSMKSEIWTCKSSPSCSKILEERRFRRLGDVQERQLDVRLIAASHEDLAQLVRQKKFRSDLYFRVSTVIIRVPPLRERLEDIPILARHFFERIAVDLGRLHLTLSDQTIEAMTTYSWPGNIRELKNVIERAVLLATGETIRPNDLHLEFRSEVAVDGESSQLTFRELQRLHIQKALDAERGNVARAAVRLGLTRSALYNKMKLSRSKPSAFTTRETLPEPPRVIRTMTRPRMR